MKGHFNCCNVAMGIGHFASVNYDAEDVFGELHIHIFDC